MVSHYAVNFTFDNAIEIYPKEIIEGPISKPLYILV